MRTPGLRGWTEEEPSTSQDLPEHRIGDQIRVMVVRSENEISVEPPLTDTLVSPSSLSNALMTLGSIQSRDLRDRIHLLLCHSTQSTPETELSFLHNVRQLQHRPYLVTTGNGKENATLQRIADEVVPEGLNESEIIRAVENNVRDFFSNDKKKETDTEPKLFYPSRFSPLPKLPPDHYNPLTDNHNLLLLRKRLKGVHALATLDADGTLIDTGSPDTILLHALARWILEHHKSDFKAGQGNLYYLEKLIEECDEWENERRMARSGRPVPGARTYVRGIKDTGDMSAWAFAGLPYTFLQRYGFEFMQTGFQGRIYDYVPEILKMTKEHGIMPIIVSGMPDVLIPPFLQMTNLRFGNGMTYKVRNGIILDEVETNMGLPDEKAELDKKLIELGYAILLMMGDSQGDAGLAISAVHRSPNAKWDFSGAAVIVHASDDTSDEFRRHHHLAMQQDRVQIPERKASDNKIISAAENALKSVFEPSAKFMNLRSNPSEPAYLNLMATIRRHEKNGTPYPNLENIKRLRDILVIEGLSQADVKEMLMRYYPEGLVRAVMKDYIEDRRRPDDMRAYYERIGCTREETDRLLNLIEADNLKQGITTIVQNRTSTPPPMTAVHVDDKSK